MGPARGPAESCPIGYSALDGVRLGLLAIRRSDHRGGRDRCALTGRVAGLRRGSHSRSPRSRRGVGSRSRPAAPCLGGWDPAGALTDRFVVWGHSGSHLRAELPLVNQRRIRGGVHTRWIREQAARLRARARDPASRGWQWGKLWARVREASAGGDGALARSPHCAPPGFPFDSKLALLALAVDDILLVSDRRKKTNRPCKQVCGRGYQYVGGNAGWSCRWSPRSHRAWRGRGAATRTGETRCPRLRFLRPRHESEMSRTLHQSYRALSGCRRFVRGEVCRARDRGDSADPKYRPNPPELGLQLLHGVDDCGPSSYRPWTQSVRRPIRKPTLTSATEPARGRGPDNWFFRGAGITFQPSVPGHAQGTTAPTRCGPTGAVVGTSPGCLQGPAA